MDYLKIILVFCLLCLINFISLVLWKITENKLNIKATEHKIDAIYLKVIHILNDKLKSGKEETKNDL